MRLQAVITVVAGVLTVVYMILAAGDIHWSVVSARPAGSTQEQIGALVFVMTGFGLGWVNAAADYSRYLPRNASGRGVFALDDVRRRGRPGDPRHLRPAAGGLLDQALGRDRASTRSAR